MISQFHYPKSQIVGISQRIFSALVLTAILFFVSGLMLMPQLEAAPKPSQSQSATHLPPQLANAVLQDLSRKVKIPVEKLKIIGYTRKTWPDACLGLSRPDEFCTQALVQGWRITLSNGRQTWAYHTDLAGRVLRLE